MKKNNFTGWKDVFRFTFVQNMKSKGSIIFTAIIFLVAALLMPIMSLINSGEDANKKSPIKKVYVVNETNIDIVSAINECNKDTEFDDIKYENVSDIKETEKMLDSDEENATAIIMVFGMNAEVGSYEVKLEYSKKGELSEMDVEEFSYAISEEFSHIMSIAFDITEEQMAFVNKQVITEVIDYTGEPEEVTEEKDILNEMQYSLLLAIICIMAFVVSFTGESVATAIITEKSSKIIEFLLTSIKPMAIIIGKVFAMISVILVEVLVMFVGLFVSFIIDSQLNDISVMESVENKIGSFLSAEALSGLSASNIIIAIIAILLGLMFYGMIAGLVGATVNKIEESAEGLKVYNFAMVAGSYITIAASIMGISGGLSDAVIKIICLFPLSAPFALPGFTLIGLIDIASMIIAIVIMLVCIIILTVFTANVYEEIIYHNGEQLKLKDIVRIYKNNKRG